MTRRKRLIAVVCLCLALVLGVAALVTLRTAPADTAAQTPETNAADTPEATASGAFDVRETESPAAGPAASPSAVPSAAPTTTPTAAAKATPSPAPTAEPTPAPTQETVTITIECHTALASDALGDAVRAVLPESGVILAVTEAPLETGDTVWTLLQRVTREHGVALEADWVPAYNTAYVQGIGHLYEFDCGQGSGWIYSVNGTVPGVGCSAYTLQPGDAVRWVYTCDYGNDV